MNAVMIASRSIFMHSELRLNCFRDTAMYQSASLNCLIGEYGFTAYIHLVLIYPILVCIEGL